MHTIALDDLFADWDHADRPGGVVAVIENGITTFARAYGMADLERSVPLSTASVFDIASISKQFVACCVLLLVETGQIALDADIRDYLPELPAYETTITVRHLLHHTGGLPEYLDLMHLCGLSPANDYPEALVLGLLARRRTTLYAPGERFSYSNSGYFLLGEIVARVTGSTLGAYAHKAIFAPLGMSRTQFYDNYQRIVPNRAIGYERLPDGSFATDLYLFDLVGDGGVLTSVGDLALWDANFYANRLGSGGPALIAQMLATRPLNDGSPNLYAAGLQHGDYRGLPTVSHSGGWAGYRSVMLRFPEQRCTVIILCNRGDGQPEALGFKVADRVLAAQLALAAPASESSGPPADDVDAETAADLSGAYRAVESGNIIQIDLEDAVLYFRHPSGFTTRLRPAAERSVTAEAIEGMQLQFTPDAGPADGFLMHLENDRTVRFDRLQPRVVTAAEAAALVGRYHCAELDITYSVTADGSALTAHLPNGLGQHALTASIEDEFNSRLGSWRLTRGAAGQIDGFMLRFGALTGLRFDRL